MYGTLYLCGTPIGNLGDMTFRAIEILKSCDLIAAEDTRNSLKILNHFDIQKPLVSYHEHNKFQKGPELIEKLKSGLNIALVTDAGMPGISDPGVDLVRLCHKEGVPVTASPGPTAFSTALVLSGMDSRRFIFEGFLPSDKKEKQAVLKSIEKETRTVIFYEAPHRLKTTLKELYSACGNREASCVREITKKFEEVRTAPLNDLISYYEENEPKGEFVVIISGADEEVLKQEEIAQWDNISLEDHMRIYMDKGLTEKDAMKQVAKDRGLNKRDIYAVLKGNK